MTTTDTPTLAPGVHVHLVGIGGAGMSALATLLIERGHPVSGSDLRGGRATSALQALGATVHVGHDAQHLAGADVVAASTAVPEENPELVAARRTGIPVLRRAELLAALIEGFSGILVAGTHGKTTTTSMLTVVLQAAGLDPSFAIGGRLNEAGTSAHHGTGELFVAEADESDSSFLAFRPDCAVVTNVDLDHHDHFADLAAVDTAFEGFLANRRAGAPVVLCADDEGARRLAARADPPVLTYGRHEDADLRIVDEALGAAGSRFSLLAEDRDLGGFDLRVPGAHNVENAAAAVAVARWAGAELDAVRRGLARFAGAQRRFQHLGEAAGVQVVDDYAHHPTELAATLQAAQQTSPAGRVIALFQPHRYSRTAALGPDLGAALARADRAMVTDVYAAGETPVAGVTGQLVAESAEAAGVSVAYTPTTSELIEQVLAEVEPGDLVVTMGAGDVTEVGPQLLDRLRGRSGLPPVSRQAAPRRPSTADDEEAQGP
ncbi:UDP-N-acetylmuramate--L-alanine ligase [Egibacter rhizosphaerae]|uniref:UDP-N-acetylmuramate--L-alanine ligase n=1 Tax=Egibacter rhizosphaerae TaxID=1670831 RepID=A0A411YA96_9ACTN|nr:UDP-N-acetylmuramate--L-alanine ligase [Egibacter rhizosphaerae]QBI18131.1 UDP-N-acetylmuramate--L-alanine ligase [Egibacter rhizosphaerae]